MNNHTSAHPIYSRFAANLLEQMGRFRLSLCLCASALAFFSGLTDERRLASSNCENLREFLPPLLEAVQNEADAAGVFRQLAGERQKDGR